MLSLCLPLSPVLPSTPSAFGTPEAHGVLKEILAIADKTPPTPIPVTEVRLDPLWPASAKQSSQLTLALQPLL